MEQEQGIIKIQRALRLAVNVNGLFGESA